MFFTFMKHIKLKFSLGRAPNFLVIGAAKCGTTSVMKYVEEYGLNFKPPMVKEARYFTEYSHLPIKHYHANFSLFNNCVTGEATPDYLYYQKSPGLIKKYGQVSKFVVILRNPVSRAFSQYVFQNYVNKSEVSDKLSFSKAIRMLDDRFYVDKNIRFYSEYKHFSYIQRGYYYDQLIRWHEYFPPTCFHVMFLEELQQDFSGEMLKLLSFLNIEYNGKPFKQVVYNRSISEHHPKLSLEDESFLKSCFKEQNRKLFSLLNKTPLW